MMKLLIGTMVLTGSLLVSIPVFAQTYQYVDTSGKLQSVVADTPQEAINNAPNIAANSGVMTARNNNDTTPVMSGSHTYRYVDTQGLLQTQVANSPAEAMALAPNLGLHSGVWLVIK